MIRTLITPEKQDVSIHIPEKYIGKQIEVLLYAVDELNESDSLKKKKPSDFRGALKLTGEQYADFQSLIKDIRNEWDRDI
ncbi:MAG: hypothetical protein ACHQIM_07860 [Sphingobacteriales bacterium]